jgi:hypothetical protein
MKQLLLIIAIIISISIAVFANENTNAVNNTTIQNTSHLLSNASDGTNIDSKYSNSLVQNVEQEPDSSAKNEIVSLYSQSQLQFFVKIELAEYNVEIKLLIFNMLGNLVKEAFAGIATKGVEYDFDASNLPNGLYLCILEGPNFRDAEKFTISR